MDNVFTETTDGVNITGNQLNINCITSNQNKFHLDSDGNLTVNSITTSQENNDSLDIDTVYPVGSIYTSTDSTNPSTLFGGTWNLKKSYQGGELVGFGIVKGGSINNTSPVSNGEACVFSDLRIPDKVYDVTNYVDNVLTGQGGAILVKPQGIVGLVEAHVYISGLGSEGLRGLWWLGNGNPLSEGVSMLPVNGYNVLTTGPIDYNYGGNSNTYFYKISDATATDAVFYVNPSFQPYGGSFTPARGGTCCQLMVKAYAKAGSTYVWERIA